MERIEQLFRIREKYNVFLPTHLALLLVGSHFWFHLTIHSAAHNKDKASAPTALSFPLCFAFFLWLFSVARINLSLLLTCRFSVFLLQRCVRTRLIRTAHVKENFYITRNNLFIYCPSATNFKAASGYIAFKSREWCYSDNFLFATKTFPVQTSRIYKTSLSNQSRACFHSKEINFCRINESSVS